MTNGKGSYFVIRASSFVLLSSFDIRHCATMLLGLLTILIMLAVAYAYWSEGLLTACTMCINMFLAGLVAFNFFEPIADALESIFADTFLRGWEDAVSL